MKLEKISERLGSKMSDEEFKRLELKIRAAMDNLNQLQQLYRAQTGRDYQPFR